VQAGGDPGHPDGRRVPGERGAQPVAAAGARVTPSTSWPKDLNWQAASVNQPAQCRRVLSVAWNGVRYRSLRRVRGLLLVV
jgi:hypothetical protein